jgi:hypothetical protein
MESNMSGIPKTVGRIRLERVLKGAKVLLGGPAVRTEKARLIFEDQNAGRVDFLASSLGEALAYALALKAPGSER